MRVMRSGYYEVLENVSEAGALRFSRRGPQLLDPPIEPIATWVHDINGDGMPDLLVEESSASAVFVWYGLGGFRFRKQALRYQFVWAGLAREIDKEALAFVDANRDGLADVLLTQEGRAVLYLNRGRRFEAVDVPAIRQVRSDGTSARRWWPT